MSSYYTEIKYEVRVFFSSLRSFPWLVWHSVRFDCFVDPAYRRGSPVSVSPSRIPEWITVVYPKSQDLRFNIDDAYNGLDSPGHEQRYVTWAGWLECDDILQEKSIPYTLDDSVLVRTMIRIIVDILNVAFCSRIPENLGGFLGLYAGVIDGLTTSEIPSLASS